MLKRRCLILLGLAGVLAIPSCATDPSGTPGPALSQQPQPIRITDVPPPPGVSAAVLRPYDEAQLAKAQLSREEIVGSLTLPRHLERFGQPAETPDAAPPLAAQRFYAAGKQALLENDNFRAVQQLDKALRLSPNDPTILRSLGRAWTRAGNRVSAAGFYRRAYAADPTDFDSLFLLGRFAIDQRRWDQAILNFDAALRLADPTSPQAQDTPGTANPTAAHLLRYYLANALNQAGYGQAAAELFDNYLRQRVRLTAASPYTREAALLANQRGETLMVVGDLQHRLNKPLAARDAYTAAAELGVLNNDALLRRVLYTQLRLGQTRAAQELIAQGLAASAGDAKTLELIPYALAQGVSAEALSQQLTTLYEQQGQPASLALAAADALPAEVAVPLLRSHLESQPGDDAVFGRLIALLLNDASNDSAKREAVAATVNAMADSPELAERYADRLLANTDDPAALLPHFPDPPTAASTTLRGKTLLALDRPDEAFASFTEALNLNSTSALARFELATLLLDRGETDEAQALLEPLHDSADPRATALRVRLLTANDQPEAALTLLNEALKRTPPGSTLMQDKAALLLQLNRVAEAEQTLLDALNARPTDEAIYAALLDIYNNHGNFQRNYQRLVRRMVDTIPNARITQLVRIQTLIALRQHAQAQQLLEAFEANDEDRQLIRTLRLENGMVLELAVEVIAPLLDAYLEETAATGSKPDDTILRNAIRYFVKKDDQKKAASVAELFWKGQPPSEQRSFGLCRAYFQLERFDEAVEVAQQAIDNDLAGSESLQMTVLLIAALFELEQFENAIAAAEKMLDTEIDDNNAVALTFELVDELAARDRLADAETYVDRFVAKRPDVGAPAILQLALRFEDQGDTPASRRIMEAGLERYPDHAALNNSLGYGLANDGIRLNDAERMIARAVAAQPDAAAYLDSMGWVFYKKGEFKKALDWLKRSEAADGGAHPVIVDHLGDTYYRLGKPADAARAWNTARRIMSTEGYQSLDPEEVDLPERLDAKIRAVAEDRPASVAKLGQGVQLPLNPELLPDNAAHTELEIPTAAAPPAEPTGANAPDSTPSTPVASEPAKNNTP